jgi:uncharacterized membrane protein YdjX (TVP38/TMEM64 family)
MPSIKEKITSLIKGLRNDYGRIGFWAAYALVMPIFGLTFLSAGIYQSSSWFKESPSGPFVFAILVAILCGLAILTTNVISAVSGWAFGFWIGLASVSTGIIGAVAINFLFSRKLAGDKFDQILKEKPKINAIHEELLKGHLAKVFLIIFLLRLSISPFAGTNYLISASGVTFRTYFIATVIGYIPRTAAWVFVGTTIDQLRSAQVREPWMLMMTIGATVLAVVLLSILSKRALKRLTLRESQEI